ncbi:type II secretion system protein H (GspH) [Rhizobium sp. RU20A]|uniref:GspH/FimT family pseudopilin n=1 Tax=Rhizobium sp. RU20A TaxID=1907412 RepID=UPI0009572CDB|nr:GspH/FimT family pseudopilin [Rhizobium sp. RU20A]SIQ86821.1 type II secretion system protein H (GspH) [Rhizobium sp. RU20A]
MIRAGDGPSAHCEAGFTLVEVLVVLAIVAVVASVSLLGTGASRDARQAAEAASAVAAGLRQARLSAIQSGTPVSVGFVATPDGVTMTAPRALRLQPGVVISALGARAPLRAGEGGGGGDGGTILFLPDGRSSGGQVQVKVGAITRDIRINWLTGLVSEASHATR